MPLDKKELLAALKDPSIQAWLRSQVVQNASVTGLGRFPGQGSAQVDTYPFPDAADATFPYNFKYLLPGNYQRLVAAKLSFTLQPYRTYSTITLASTGGQSVNHHHPHTHGSHGHQMFAWSSNGGSLAISDWTDGSSTHIGFATTGHPPDTLTSFGATPTSDNTAADVDHTHTVSGTTTLGIAEDAAPSNPGITVTIDGVDVTAQIGGPFNSDMIEVDITQVLKTTPKIWHTLALQPNQRVRIYGLLSLRYYVDSRLAQ